MSVRCRTCGKLIVNLNGKNLIEPQNKWILHEIESLTGIWPSEELDMPDHICAFCLLDLNHAISFRERCIKTHKLLLNGKYDKNQESVMIENLDNDDPLNNADDSNNDDSDELEITQSQSPSKVSPKTIPAYNRHVMARPILQAGPTTSQGMKTAPNIKRSLPTTLPKKKPIILPAKPTKNSQLLQSESQNEDERKDTKAEPARKSYLCDQCGRHFNDSSNLKMHLVVHTGVKEFECKECDHKSYNQYLLNLHIRVRHLGEKPFACKYCGQRFFTSTSRCRHEQKRHSTERSFVCPQCDKSFFTKSCLRKHEFMHSNERPHRCETCDVAFQRKTNLKIHFRSKLHQRMVEATAPVNEDNAQMIMDDEIDFNSIDSLIEEVDE